jgi:hypothetical protein
VSARHYAEHRAQERFVRNAQLLELELEMRSPRRHLNVLLELLGLLVEQCGSSVLASTYRVQLIELKQRVTTRSNLRLVQS